MTFTRIVHFKVDSYFWVVYNPCGILSTWNTGVNIDYRHNSSHKVKPSLMESVGEESRSILG